MKLITKFTMLIILCTLVQIAYSMSPEDQLFQYTNEDNIQKLKELFEAHPNLNISFTEQGKWTPLHKAAEKNSVKAAALLLQKGADIHARSLLYSDTPLHTAARNNSVAVAILLLDKGADINALDSLGYTPLHCAVVAYSIDMVKLLLERGADSNIQIQKYGDTALHRAVDECNTEIISYLMDNVFIDLSIKNRENKTALNQAIIMSSWSYEHQKNVTVIQRKQAENEKLLRFLFFFIKLALKYNQPEIFAGLVKNNRRIALALRDAETGNNILHLAVLTEKTELIRLAFQYLPELINVQNKNKQKPFELPQAQQFLMKYLVQPFFHRYTVLDSILQIPAY